MDQQDFCRSLAEDRLDAAETNAAAAGTRNTLIDCDKLGRRVHPVAGGEGHTLQNLLGNRLGIAGG